MKADLEETWERWYALRGKHPEVSEEVSKKLKEAGFFAGSCLWYDFDKFGMELYLNDKEMCRLHPINGWFTKLIDDKRYGPVIFRNKPHLVADLNIAVECGLVKYVLENGRMVAGNHSLPDTVRFYLEKYGSLFVKPAGLSGSRGLFTIDSDNYNERINSFDTKHAYLINELFANEAYSEQINPCGLNTFRVYFFRGSKGIRVLKILHRFGTKKSQNVDSISLGSIACEVDIESGRMARGFAPYHEEIRVDVHPDSNIKLTGFAIPEWDDKIKRIEEILDNLAFLDFAGFDVAATTKGMRLLEVNSLPNRSMMQIDSPALVDSEFLDFLMSKGYRIGQNSPAF